MTAKLWDGYLIDEEKGGCDYEKILIALLVLIYGLSFAACTDIGSGGSSEMILPKLPVIAETSDDSAGMQIPDLPSAGDNDGQGCGDTAKSVYTVDTRISDVINDPVFGEWGRMIFPVNRGYYSGDTLGNLRLTWYNNINAAHTVEICNYFRDQTVDGNIVFYDIYTESEKAADPRKADTGLFFFRGNQGAPFAVTCAGGGWAYVGAMHDSFPHALELSKRGYNAFAIIYRPGAQTAYEDLARAITVIFNNAEEFGIDTDGYSIWGRRMAATISSYGVQTYGGGANVPKPSVAVIQYTGHTDYNESGEPATFVCVGESDGIASCCTMKNRIDNLAAMGVPTEYHSYAGLGHGFGLGIGTIAETWFDQAVAFWERNR